MVKGQEVEELHKAQQQGQREELVTDVEALEPLWGVEGKGQDVSEHPDGGQYDDNDLQPTKTCRDKTTKYEEIIWPCSGNG